MIQSATSLSHPSLYAIRPIRRQRSRSPDQVRGNKVGREEKTLSWHILPLPFILAQPIPARALPCPQLEPELVPWRQRRIACALDSSRSVAYLIRIAQRKSSRYTRSHPRLRVFSHLPNVLLYVTFEPRGWLYIHTRTKIGLAIACLISMNLVHFLFLPFPPTYLVNILGSCSIWRPASKQHTTPHLHLPHHI